MIIVISGPGGVGKGTIVSRLLPRDPALWLSRSWTTRPPRPGEAPDAYTFVDRATFERRIEEGGFLEHAQIVDHLYGTPTPEPPPGRDVVLEIDVQGARQIRERYPEAFLVFVVPPSPDALVERMRRRGDDESHVEARLRIAAEEERVGRSIADAVVVNDDLERVVDEVLGMLERRRRAGTEQHH